MGTMGTKSSVIVSKILLQNSNNYSRIMVDPLVDISIYLMILMDIIKITTGGQHLGPCMRYISHV